MARSGYSVANPDIAIENYSQLGYWSPTRAWWAWSGSIMRRPG